MIYYCNKFVNILIRSRVFYYSYFHSKPSSYSYFLLIMNLLPATALLQNGLHAMQNVKSNFLSCHITHSNELDTPVYVVIVQIWKHLTTFIIILGHMHENWCLEIQCWVLVLLFQTSWKFYSNLINTNCIITVWFLETVFNYKFWNM